MSVIMFSFLENKNMNRLFIYYHILISTLPWQIGICQQGYLQSEVRITKYENCNVTGLKFILQNGSISYLYPASYVNIILNVTEETEKFNNLMVHVYRCNDQGFSCEDFQTWRLDNFCSILNWKNQMWNGVVDTMQPPFRCPIRKTLYYIRNATYDFNSFVRWYPDFAKYHWRMKAKVFNEKNELVFCCIVESHVYQYRKRNRKS